MNPRRPEEEVVRELVHRAEHLGADARRNDHGPSAAAGMRTILDYVHLRLQRVGQVELADAADAIPTDVAAAYRNGYLMAGE